MILPKSVVSFFLLFILLGAGLQIHVAEAQPPPRYFSRGLAVQAYPAGVIINGHMSYFFRPEQTWTLYVGVNITNRRDWGEHDEETGSGAGAGLGWRYFFNGTENGWHAGLRTDVWFMTIDWRQDTGESGDTEIGVLQPTAQLGYSIFPAESRWIFDVTASLGAEINFQTRGQPVGEGAIFLLGISGAYRF